MAKGTNQKLKLLYLLDFLRENTNPDHPVSRREIEAFFEANDISVERKTVYDDVEWLKVYGVNIEKVMGKYGGYYCDGGDFSLPEIKMLVDSVQSSKFITEQQSVDLIKKLERLTNKWDASQLQRQVVVQDRVKTKQTNIFNNIDHISNAIAENRKIRFKYLQYNVKKELEEKRDGADYEVSPLTLLWDSENYYLIAYDSAEEKTKHFRVDKMKNIRGIQAPREGTERLTQQEISCYTQRVFGMFHGEEKDVTIRFKNSLIGVVIDRFGKDMIAVPEKDGKNFTVQVKVAVSKQFYAWLCGFVGECEVISPPEVRQELQKMGEALAGQYGEV